MSEIDHYYILLISICPPSPQGNSDWEQVAANTPAQGLAVKPDVFIITPETPSTVHVIISVGYDYGCESWVESWDSDLIIISVQNVKPKVKATKRPLHQKEIYQIYKTTE